MNKKILKIVGVMSVLATLASILAIATPVTAADRAWSAGAAPSALTFQVANGKAASFLTVAPDGTVFVVDTNAATPVVYYSTTGGAKWTASALSPWGAVPVTALAVSPAFATDKTVVVAAQTAAGPTVYISTNGGVTFGQLGGALNAVALQRVMSISFVPTYSGAGQIMVGTSDPGAGAYGDVYIWGAGGVLNWTAQGAAEDITSVAFSPNYPADATILALGSTAANFTRLHTKVGAFAWNATIAGPTLISGVIDDVGGAAGIVGSSISLPLDYNAAIPTTRRVYVGVASVTPANDNVWRVTGSSAALPPPAGVVVPLNPGISTVSIHYAGTFGTGTLYVGNYAAAAAVPATVMMSTTAAAAVTTWAPPAGAPIGTSAAAGQVAWVDLPADFATSNKVFVGTVGTNGGVSVATDGGLYYLQVGFVNVALTTLLDLQITADGNTQFLVTADAVVVGSLWKSTDAGVTWSRLAILPFGAGTGIVRLSPTFATDNTLIFAETNGGALAIRLSTDGGKTWVPRLSPAAIGDIAVQDVNTWWVGSSAAGTVTKTVNGGWTWGAPVALTYTTGNVYQLKRDAGGDILAGTTTGYVARSADAGVTFTGLAATLGAGNAIVGFDSSYGTNKVIYAAITNAAGVYRFTVGTSTAFAQIDAGCTLLPRALVSIGGVLYAVDATAAGAAAGGVERSLDAATAPVPAFELVGLGDGLTANYTLQSLVSTSANKLFAIENSGGAGLNRLVTYTDTIIAGPVVTVGAVTSGSASLSWTAITGAAAYAGQIATRSDFAGAGALAPTVATDTSLTVTGLGSGATYYVRFRVTAPVFSNWSAAQTFITALVPVGPPVAIQPLPGAENIVLNPTFSWGAVAGATSYKIELATKADFSNAVVSTSSINAWASPSALTYNTIYYWRVTPQSSAGAPAGTPIVGVFTTMAAPTTAAPPVVITQVPAPQITLQVPPAAKEPTPGYIWAVIAIGAVLVIAVIVLIWSSRRARV